jgi:O-antigen/teichoic acid export membrane protein
LKIIFGGFKDITSLGIASFITNAIGGVFWLYMASMLGTEKYGEISYFISIAILASTIALLGMSTTVIVYTSKGVKIQSTAYLSGIISAITTSIILFYIFINDVGISIYIFGFVTFTLITSNYLGQKLYSKYSKINIIQKILLVIFAVGFYHLMGLEGIILGIGISFILFFGIIIKSFKEMKIDYSIFRSRYKFILNSFLLDLTRASSGSVDKLIIAPLLGFALLGNYQLGIQYIALLHIVPGIVFQYTLAHDAIGNQNKSLKKIVILFSVLLAILSIIFAPIFVPILFPEFVEAVEIIQVMSLAIIPASIITTNASKYLGRTESKIVLIGSGVYLCSQIILILILGTIWGVNGATISIVIATTIHAFYYIIINRFFDSSKNK